MPEPMTVASEPLARRAAWARGAEFRVAQTFVRLLNGLGPDARRAWILYLADRYLEMKPRDFMRAGF